MSTSFEIGSLIGLGLINKTRLGWSARPRYSPVSVFPNLGLLACASSPGNSDYDDSLVPDFSRKLRIL